MSFSFDFTYDSSLSSSAQGQLSSSYTNALSSYLQNDGADFVAFLAYVANELSVEAALELKAEIEAGNFSLSGLFSAAQSKTGEVDGALISDPEPTLTVTVGDVTYTIDLTAMLTGTDTATWTSGNAKNTVHHTREFFTSSTQPDGYSPDWADPTEPVNEAPSPAWFTEAVVEFDIKAGEPENDNHLVEIDLLQNAVDPEEDALSVVDGTVVVKLNGEVVSSDAFSIEGNTLVIDTNSDYFDTLFKDQKWTFEVTYDITDGVNVVASAGSIEVTGTADQFTLEGTFTGGQTSGFNTTTWDGSFNVVIPTSSLIEGADAYFDFEGNVTVSATGDLLGTTETIKFTVEGNSTQLTLGGAGPGPFGGHEPGDNNYVDNTVLGLTTFLSNDSSVVITYDSNTSNANNGNAGVDGLTSVSAELSDVTYWA